jgi:hypothetical protein
VGCESLDCDPYFGANFVTMGFTHQRRAPHGF